MKIHAAILLALLGSGCSPYLYTTEIDAFATATENLTAGLGEAQKAIRTGPEAHAFWAAYANTSLRVRFRESACESWSKTTCHVSVAGKSYALSEADADLLRDIQKVRLLAGYVAGLRAVINAKDREAFDAARTKLAASAAALVGTGTGNPAAGPIAQVTVRAGTTVLGYFLDQARFDQLRASVRATDPHFAKIADPLTRALQQIRDHRIKALKRRMGTVQAKLGSKRISDVKHERLLVQLQADVRTLAALQRAPVGDLATKLVASHAALARALEDGRIDTVAVIKAIDEFATIAADFKQALTSI